MFDWKADVGNDPDREFELVVELMEGNEYRGRLKRDDKGKIVLEVYGGDRIQIPVKWLQGVIDRAEKEVWISER